MKFLKLTDSNYCFVYLTGFLFAALLIFIAGRDSCANPDYAKYMGPETCPALHK